MLKVAGGSKIGMRRLCGKVRVGDKKDGIRKEG